MKKTLKKITSLALVLIMLITLTSVQAFATFDFLRAPTITSVEFSENSYGAVSLKELNQYYDDLEELIRELEAQFGDIDGLLEENSYLGNMYAELYNFDLGYSNLKYEYIVSLSNGKKVTVPAFDGYAEVNAFVDVYVDVYVTQEDYLEAVEKGADKVKLTVKGQIYSNALQDFTEDGDYTSQTELALVPEVVKSITPVSGVPSTLYSDADYIELDGAKFKIVYADGETKVAQVKQNISIKDSYYYTDVTYELDGNELYVVDYYGEEEDAQLRFSYLDEEYVKNIKYVDNPFKSVEITNCDFDYEKGLTSISYNIKWKNGKSEDYTKEFTGTKTVNFYGVIDCIDGYYVELLPYDNSTLMDETAQEELKMYICVSIGDNVSDCVEYEIPYSNAINLFVTIAEKLSAIIDFFRNIISVVLEELAGA